jgi:DUF1980 C-terminal domain
MGSHHDHHHVDDTYFLDQICMVALSGGFGVICLSLYFIQKGMLNLLLGPQFHAFVLGSGIALVVVAVIRAGMLWSMAGGKATSTGHDHADNHDAHEHSHGHDDCVHDHDNCGHEHSHGHSHAHSHSHAESDHDHEHSHAEVAQSRAFGHTPEPAPAHGHSHSHDNHDHGWAPWRYVVLLVPIILFLLGLPNKGPSVDVNKIVKFDASRDAHEEAVFYVTLAALSSDGYTPLGAIAAHAADSVAQDLQTVDVKLLEGIAEKKTDRDYWKGKAIRVRGQFVPQSTRVFSLVRFRIQCCAGDAIQVSIPVVAKDNLANIKPPSWVEVDGRIDFRADANGAHKTVVIVSKQDHVRECNPDLNPYLQ